MTPEELARYLADESPEEEERRVRTWLETEPGIRARLETGDAPDPSYREPRRVIEAVLNHPSRRDRKPTRRLLRRTAIAAAAVALMLIVVLTRDERRTEYATGPGERREVTLEDGTAITLNASSLLEADYARSARSVRLEGEAFFDVVSDSSRPFVVRTSSVRVQVLGTKFNVDAYEDEVVVVVSEGRVLMVTGSNDRAVLEAGRRGRSIEGIILVDDVDESRRLVFRATPLADVARELGRRYDVEVELSGTGLDTLRVDAALHDVSLDEAVLTISKALELEYSITGRKVELRRATP
jgi:ferric-dicitrate binding protein FerR (iron transport regulator)